MIEKTSFGSMVTTDGEYRTDLILFGPGVKGEGEVVQSHWRRKEGHDLDPADLESVEEAAPGFLVIGRGAHGRMVVPDRTLAWLRGIEIEAVVPGTTGEAAEAYNDLVKRGARVVGAFHLTC